MILRPQHQHKVSPNERLFLSGQLGAFEQAVLEEHFDEAVALLVNAGLSRSCALDIAKEVFSDPRKYGYCPGGCLQGQ